MRSLRTLFRPVSSSSEGETSQSGESLGALRRGPGPLLSEIQLMKKKTQMEQKDSSSCSQIIPPDLGPTCIPVMINVYNVVPVYVFLSTICTFTVINTTFPGFPDRVGLVYPDVPPGDPLSQRSTKGRTLDEGLIH